MNKTPPELMELLTALTDVGLNEPERARLEQLISNDPTLQDLYLDYIELHSMLAWQHGSRVSIEPRQEQAAPAPAARVAPLPAGLFGSVVQAVLRPWAVSVMVALFTTMALLFALASIYLPERGPLAAQPPKVVARLERIVDGQWANSNQHYAEGADLTAGQRLKLRSGQAAILFQSGVRVLLNGETSFQLESTNRGRLERGVLSARVPPQALGFSVMTRHAEVIDLGTEFGVQADADGAEVHVFVGKVRIVSPVLPAPHELQSGEQLRVSTLRNNGLDPGVGPAQLASSVFIRELPPRRPAQRVDGESYARAVLASQPLAYWRFSERSGPTLRDSSGHGHDAQAEPGVMLGEGGVPAYAYPGVGSKNQGAEFFGGRIIAQIALQDAYSVELWYCNRLPLNNRGITGYLFSRGEEAQFSKTGDHLGIGGTISNLVAPGALFLFNGNRANQTLATPPLPDKAIWRHLVLTREGPKVRLYVNAQLAATGDIPSTVEPDVRQVSLGGRSDKMFSLVGGLDEVSLYDRTLSPREVVQHFTAAAEGQLLPPSSP